MNKGADALSRRYLLLSALESKVLGFEVIQGMYPDDEDLKELYTKSSHHPHGSFYVQEGFLFKGTGFASQSVDLESSLFKSSMVAP